MCGIIGAFSIGKTPNPMNAKALQMFENQFDRGEEGFGIIKIMPKNDIKIDRATEPYKFLYDIHQDPVARLILHHRKPTSTPNLISQTHPIFVNNGSLKYDYLVVHNGVVANDVQTQDEHERLGFVYTTLIKRYGEKEKKFNDSECIAIELARYIEEQIDLITARGSCAFICLQLNKRTGRAEKLFFGRHGSAPLRLAKSRDIMLLASEGIGNDITIDTLYACPMDSKMQLNRRKLKIDTIVYNGESTVFYSKRNFASEEEAREYLKSHTTGITEHKKYVTRADGAILPLPYETRICKEAEAETYKGDASDYDENSEIQDKIDKAKDEISDIIDTYLDDLKDNMEMDESLSYTYGSQVLLEMKKVREALNDMFLANLIRKGEDFAKAKGNIKVL